MLFRSFAEAWQGRAAARQIPGSSFIIHSSPIRDQRRARAVSPEASASTSASVAIEVSPSVVIAAQYLRLPDSDAARVVTDVAREYRERMTNYASMRALDVWYDKIDLQRYEDRTGDPKVVAAARKRFADLIANAAAAVLVGLSVYGALRLFTLRPCRPRLHRHRTVNCFSCGNALHSAIFHATKSRMPASVASGISLASGAASNTTARSVRA